MYQNYMDNIKLSSQIIEDQIKPMKLFFLVQMDDEIEWKTMPPMFIYSFYKFIAHYSRIPTQAEFWSFYYHENKTQFSDKVKQNLQSLQARVYRAYPSFVRDVHFYYILAESEIFSQVIYHPEIDIKYGIDFIVRYKERCFGVNCYIDPPRSHQGREKKQFRHESTKKLILINLPVNFKGSKKCGQFYLYSQRELIQLISILDQNRFNIKSNPDQPNA